MKSEPKPFASLSSGLLARKGAARPAMRPQGFGGQVGGAGLDDLGWNDMGFEPPKPADAERDAEHDGFGDELVPHPLRNPVAALTPIGSPVHDQQSEISDRLSVDEADEDEILDEDYDETAELAEGEEPEVLHMPEPAPAPVAVAVAPVAVASVAIATPRRQPRPRSQSGTGGKAAFTLRLDPGRHLKLRLACAVTARSAQQLVTDAVDRMLAEMPELDSMAERAPTKRAKA
jgi:hypothetical protein